MFPAHFQLVHSVQTRLKRARSLKVASMGQIPLICFWSQCDKSYHLNLFWHNSEKIYFLIQGFWFWRNFKPFFCTFWVVGGFYFEVSDFLFSHNIIILLLEAIPRCNFKSENSFILDLVACQSCGLPAWEFNIEGKSQILGFPIRLKYNKTPKACKFLKKFQ